MQRISNRTHNQAQHTSTQVHYVEVPVEKIVEVEKIIEKIVETSQLTDAVEATVIEKIVHVEAPAVDLTEIHEKIFDLESQQMVIVHSKNEFIRSASTELESQRRALVGIKAQRTIDRQRRLQFINRVKKERDEARKTIFKLKLAIGASLLISIVSLIVKL